METTLETLEERLYALENQKPDVEETTGTADDSGNEEPELVFKSVNGFVDNYLRPMLETWDGSKMFWCERWQENHIRSEHTFQLLWCSYEEAAAQDKKTSGGSNETAWLNYHFYPLVEKLLSSSGPHGACTKDVCKPPPLIGQQ